jgi:hypothetical protein
MAQQCTHTALLARNPALTKGPTIIRTPRDHLNPTQTGLRSADAYAYTNLTPQHLPYDERRLDLTCGNGSPLSVDELQQFVDAYDRFGMPIDWNVGDVAVMCNYQFAHGRPGIDLSDGEQRELGVVLGARFDRVGVLDDRW